MAWRKRAAASRSGRALASAPMLVGALAAAVAALAAPTPSAAQSVSMSGSLGDKALLMIDGTPRTVAAGSTVQGVKLVSVSGSGAVVEVQGKRVALVLGGAQVNLGGAASAGGGSQIVLTAGTGGHFLTQGSINGRSVRFLVDTGATMVTLSQADADRVGLDYRHSQQGVTSTANGPVVVWRMQLGAVRVGDVQVYDVDAIVVPAAMDWVLLGNSFLTRFQMKQDNDKLTLDKRF